MKKVSALLILLFAIVQFTLGQKPSNPPANAPRKAGSGFKMPAIGRVYGKLFDASTKETLPFTPVVVLKKDSVVGGGLSGSNGEFNIEKLPFGKFSVKIAALGYKALFLPIVITQQNFEQDLGNIKIEAEGTMLNSVNVTAEKSASEISIDRKVFNVDKNITSKGGTASDVMNNVPSVTIDANGNPLLRQQAATVYIDGRPTTLTLDQIPADQIERVEVITNPSAKYEASATGGIINIVMKENNKPGYNGMLTAGLGTNEHHNGMFVFNMKEKPFGISLVYNYNGYKNPVDGIFTNRTNLLDGAPTSFYNSYDNLTFQRIFQTGSVTFDYYLNNRNTLSLSETMVIGDFTTWDTQTFNTLGPTDSLRSNGTRLTPYHTHFENYTTKLHWKKTFPEKGRELNTDLALNTSSIGTTDGTYTTNQTDYSGGIATEQPVLNQKYNGYTNSQMYTFQSDYVHPINDTTKWEFGVRSNYKPSQQGLAFYDQSTTTSNYILNQPLTSYYNIQDLVNAAYANYTTKAKYLSYSVGLRFEESIYKGIVTNKNDSSFSYNYPTGFNNLMNALFPSIFLSRKISPKRELQFNITRKINRPNYRQLMPFIQASDAKDYTIGNPNLTPEFITSAELNFNQILDKGNLFFTLFYRNSQNPLTSYTYQLPSDPSILVSTTINGSLSNSYGMDNTFKYSFFKVFETTLNMNLFYTAISSNYNNVSLSNQGFNYTAKVNLIYHFPANFNLQLSGNYESPKIVPQGKTYEVYFADAGLSKEIHKFLTLTASVNDMFNTKGRGTMLNTDVYTQNSWTRRESRYFKLTLTVKFGNTFPAMFKRKAQRPDDADGDM